MPIGFIKLFHSLSDGALGNIGGSAVVLVQTTLSISVFISAWLEETQSDDGILQDRIAVKHAKALLSGNKVLLKLVRGNRACITDSFLFIYEFTTALMLRILTMTIPDERTAQLVGLIGAVGEVCVRIFFFNLFFKTGIRRNKRGMSNEETYSYALWGKLRVQDGINDMAVEYISSITSALLLIHLSPLDAFSFATSDKIDESAVLTICLYQIVPEIFLDLYVTFME